MKKNKLAAVLAAAAVLSGCGEVPGEEQAESRVESLHTTAAESSVQRDESQPELIPEEDEEGLYDTSPISQAYLSGDTSELDKFQLQIYGLAVKVLDEVITDGMTDYEKELAVHDYIIRNVEYDLNNISIFETHGEHASDPYGALAEGRCICSGYTTTFQMFMDMLEIPCRSIQAADDDGEDHAWNMVELNGHWYYVDVTWDDPVPDIKGRPVHHNYFNVSEETMAKRHVWDSVSEPETDSEEDSYIAHSLTTVDSAEEVYLLLEQAVSDGSTMNIFFEPADHGGWSLDKAEGTEKRIDPTLINEELAEVGERFEYEHRNFSLRWHRIAFDGRVVVGVDMIMYE